MRRLQFKFPNQIRISGWDFGSSARAMNQAGGKDSLMTYELVRELYAQADLEKVSRSTTERKSMSTKTTIKRIALVAVSALGLGVLTSVAPASAFNSGSATVTLGTASATPGVTGRELAITVPFTVTAASASDTITVGASVFSKPGTSSATDTTTYWTTEAAIPAVAAGGVSTYVADVGSTNATNNNYQTQAVNTVGNVATYNNTNSATFYFTPDKAGTYTIAYFIDKSGLGTVDSGDIVKYLSITVADAPASTVVVSKPLDGTFALYDSTAGTTAGAWIKLQVADASGTASRLNGSQTVKLSIPSGVTLNTVGATSVDAAGPVDYQLAVGSFSASGVAYVNLRGTTAGSYSITASVTDSTATAGSASVTFKAHDAYASLLTTGFLDPAGNATAATPIIGSSTADISSASAATANAASTSHSLYVGTTTEEGIVPVRVTSSLIWGTTSRSVDLVVTASDTLATTDAKDGMSTTKYKAAFSLATTLSINNDYSYKTVSVNSWTASGSAGTAVVFTGAKADVSALSRISPTASTVLSATGATTSVTVRCLNQFGGALPNIVLTPVITGRNSTVVVSPAVTNATGYASFSYTDASTSTTNLQDLISFTGCSDTATKLTVNYTSTANLGVSTLTWTAGGGYADSDYYEGYARTAISGGNDPSTNAYTTLTFTVKDVSGSAIAGVPVTFALTGNASSLIVKSATVDYSTVYTGADGTAATRVFAWAPGKSTVTATAGGKTATGYITWKNSATLSHARVLSATASGNVVSLKVVDRFGNGVEGVSISLSRTGTGYFGTGASTATATTDENGTVDVQFNGNGSVKATLGTGAVQAYDAANKIGTLALTAAVAGTTTGTGSTLAPAGVYTVSVDVSDQSSNAVDAANEATEAANAATDAANAAAEAADAATAAAQDAQAAVADLAAQVATLISGIKAQITRLTNLVIKIQKKVNA